MSLSANSDNVDDETQKSIQGFIGSMRKLIAKSQIFHVNLSGMNLGKHVEKLVEAIKISPSLNSIHLSQNNLPADLVDLLDRTLKVPQTDEVKIRQFRQDKKEEEA